MFKLFSVGVKQTGSYVHITGVSFGALASDIERFYSTSLITKYQLRRESWDTIKLHNFYLVELHFILGKLLQLRNLRSRRRELNELKHLLETETWLKDTFNPIGTPFNFARMNAFNTDLLPAQREFLDNYPIIRDSYHLKGMLLDSVPGSGKAMPLDTLVKVPKGWRRLGDLRIGDPVIGPKGTTVRVKGVYPQGITDCYRFTFEDGRTAISHPDHLWQVTEADKGGVSNQNWYPTTTKDIVANINRFDYRIPLVEGVDGLRTLSVTHADAAENLLLSSTKIDNSILECSYEDRFAVAQEMLKQGTTHIQGGVVALLFHKQQPALNFRSLIWSLGGIAELKMYGGLYRVVIKHRNIETLAEDLYDAGYSILTFPTLQLKIVAIEQIEPLETMCISVTGEDRLYIVDDWVVTHNTFTSIAWSHLISDNKTVVISPLNIVQSVWEQQLKTHYKQPPRIWTSKMGLPLTDAYDYYIIHYEALQGDLYEVLKKGLLKIATETRQPFKLILDESHNFNEVKAKQTRRLIELCDLGLFSDTLPMSGTPLKALGSEAFPVICMIDPYFDRQARDFFLASYGRNRPQMLELLSHRIGRGKFTIPELQGMGDPPPFEIVKVKVPHSDRFTLDAIKLEMQTYIAERIRFYNAHIKEFVEFFNEVVARYEYSIAKQPKELAELQQYKAIVHRFRTQGYNNFTDAEDSKFCKLIEERIELGLKGSELADFRNVKSAVKYLGLKLRGEALGNVLGKARIEAIKSLVAYADLPKYIDDVEKKTLVFTTYVEALKITADELVSKGYTPITVYGENNHERDRSVRQFAEDPNINPCIATYDSLKEGYPLVMANQILSLNAPWRDYEIKQTQARIWRRGQDTPCFFRMFDLDTGDKLNITTRSINILEWSKEQVDALLGKMQGHVSFANVTGEELLDVSEEPLTRRIRYNNSLLTLF